MVATNNRSVPPVSQRAVCATEQSSASRKLGDAVRWCYGVVSVVLPSHTLAFTPRLPQARARVVSGATMAPIMVRYLASVFVDAQELTPNTQIITTLLTSLNRFQLLPNMISVLTPNGVSQRMAFQSSDGSKQLVLNLNRFDFTYSASVPLSDGLVPFNEFCNDATEALLAALQQFGHKANRLAAVRDSFLVNLPEDQKTDIARNW
jgi:hypothetical protein